MPALTPGGDQRDRRRAHLASLQHHRRRGAAAGGGGRRQGRLAHAVDASTAAPIEVLDAMSSWWTAVHGHGHPVLDAAITAQLATMNHVMFGGLTHEPAARLAQLLVRDHPGRPGHGVLQRLRLGVGRGGGQDGAAVLAQPGPAGQTPADDLARRLPRRHLHPDERVRPRRRHALDLDRRPGAARCSRPQVPGDYDPAYSRGLRTAAGRARRRTGRGHRRAGGAGRRRHAVPRPALPDRPARRSATGTACCSSSTRSPPASAAPGRCSPPTTPVSAPTSCASARR